MKRSKNLLNKILKILLKINLLILLLLFSKNSFANNISIEIKGNKFTDEAVIESLIEKKPENISQDYADYLLKILDKSQLFENVTITLDENKYIIIVKEFPNIRKIYFKENKRIFN